MSTVIHCGEFLLRGIGRKALAWYLLNTYQGCLAALEKQTNLQSSFLLYFRYGNKWFFLKKTLEAADKISVCGCGHTCWIMQFQSTFNALWNGFCQFTQVNYAFHLIPDFLLIISLLRIAGIPILISSGNQGWLQRKMPVHNWPP